MDLLKEFKAICEVKIYNSKVQSDKYMRALPWGIYLTKAGYISDRETNFILIYDMDVDQNPNYPTAGYIYFTNYGTENMLCLLSC